MLSFKPAFSPYSFTFFKRLFSSSLLSTIREISSAYLRLSMCLPAVLIPACASSSPARISVCIQYIHHRIFCMVHSVYKLNKQDDNIQASCTPFPIGASPLFCLVANCSVWLLTGILTVASWLAYWFCRRQVRWSGIPISWRIFQNLLWSTQSKS